VDVYSFGVVLWEICTGRVPTRGRLADPDVPGDCPADILMLIRECMQAGSSPPCAAQLPTAVLSGHPLRLSHAAAVQLLLLLLLQLQLQLR
jgi:hypothetical protein